MGKLLSVFLVCMFCNMPLFSQERIVKGTVTDVGGNSLPGVSIMVKGTSTGVVSDNEGKYTIKVPDKNAILSFTFIGYKKVEIPVGEQTTVNVTLTEDVTELEQVVVIGYGVQKKVILPDRLLRSVENNW